MPSASLQSDSLGRSLYDPDELLDGRTAGETEATTTGQLAPRLTPTVAGGRMVGMSANKSIPKPKYSVFAVWQWNRDLCVGTAIVCIVAIPTVILFLDAIL